MIMDMKKFLGKSIFKATGWTYNVDPAILENKQVIIGFEHTSNPVSYTHLRAHET